MVLRLADVTKWYYIGFCFQRGAERAHMRDFGSSLLPERRMLVANLADIPTIILEKNVGVLSKNDERV